MTKRWIITGVLCLLFFVGLSAFKYVEISSAIEAANSMPEYFETVESETAQAAEYTSTVKALGEVIAQQQVTLRNELPGYITRVNFTSGASIKKGQVILQLDISEQLADLESAEARASLAQSVYDRDLDLRKSNAVSQESVDRSLSELNVIKADIARINSIINRKTIRAPFNGVIGIHQFERGQYLNPNTPITTLVGQKNEVWIDFSVPQFYGEVANGQTVRVKVIRSGQVAPYFDAQVIAGNSVISSEGRSRLYRAQASNTDLQLLHNTSVEVEVPTSALRPVISVSENAIQSDISDKFVYKLVPDEQPDFFRATRQPIAILGQQDDRVIIEGGLNEGDLIASAGAFKLREGVLVNVQPRASEVIKNQGK